MNIIEFREFGLKFFVNPVALEIGNLTIRWYGIIISIGFLMGFCILMYLAGKTGYNKDVLLDFVIVVVPIAIIGARLYYVIFKFSDYKNNILSVFKIWEGGLAIYGAIIASILSAYLYCRYKKLNMMEIADMASPGLIIGQAIGRWGNFVNQEAYGRETSLPWAMTIFENGIQKSVHPTFLYESLANFLIFFILFCYFQHKKSHGEVFTLYLGLYSFGRFFIEGLRTDSLTFGPYRISQIVAIVLVIISLKMFLTFRKKKYNVGIIK